MKSGDNRFGTGDRGTGGDGRHRVAVVDLRPNVEGGAFPIKRVIGDALEVEADIVVDGHDILQGVLLHRHAHEREWHEVPLVSVGNDVYRAGFELRTLGRHLYTVEAWVDAFATWLHALTRKLEADVDVTLDVITGAKLVENAASRSLGDDARMLHQSAELLMSATSREAIQSVAQNAELAERMRLAADRSLSTRAAGVFEVQVEPELAVFSAWYEMFPRSTGRDGRHGTFREAEARLDYAAAMGFDVVYLPPIHPIGKSFRKGPDNAPEAGPGDPGSPWAIGSDAGGHTSVHPELGTLADFDHFLERARSLGLEIALDIAFQASPDHPWVKEHPEWFRKRSDGSIQYAENPPKRYQDVYPFDFESEAWLSLWEALRGVFLFWISRGVRVFRVDNPHTKPLPFWEWCIRTVQEKHPDVVFLAEAFTRPKLMYALAKRGFSQSYTYFTWRTSSDDLAGFMTELARPAIADFLRPNLWPTTPDIFPEHLHHAGRGVFLARLVLAGTLSSVYGIYGPSYELMSNVPRPSSEELANNEKYELRQWDVDRPDSLRHVIARLNRTRRENIALHDNRSLRFHRSSNDLLLCYSKRSADGRNVVLVVVNLDPRHTHSAWIELDLAELGIGPNETFQAHDVLRDERFLFRGSRIYVELDHHTMPAHLFVVRRSVRTENQFEYFL